MKILEVGTLDVRAGGPPYSISKQMVGLSSLGIESVCLMKPCDVSYIIDTKLNHIFTSSPFRRVLGFEYVPNVNKSMESICDCDIVHIQDTWTYLSHAAALYAQKSNLPYVISPRGNLYRKAMSSKKLKKLLAFHTYVKNDLNRSSCVHATCYDEMIQIRELGCKKPIAVIPNSYETKLIEKNNYRMDSVFKFGFIGRLNPRKHVERLIYGLNELKNEGFKVELLIIGQEVEKYESFLKNECKRLHLEDIVHFTGFLRGEKKDIMIKGCNVFCFPSDFENFGNVVPDVLAREIPVIATKGMPWKILEDEGCGWWVDNDQKSITDIMRIACETEKGVLQEMGRKGRCVIDKKFSVNTIGAMLKELYLWILDGGAKPDFVYI